MPGARPQERAGQRTLRNGTLTLKTIQAGQRAIAFSDRIGARALRTGRHQLTFIATDPAGNTSHARTATFSIVNLVVLRRNVALRAQRLGRPASYRRRSRLVGRSPRSSGPASRRSSA